MTQTSVEPAAPYDVADGFRRETTASRERR